MKTIVQSVLVVLMVCGAANSVRAAIDTHYVAQNGQTPSGAFTTWDSAASNIQEAVDQASAGDTVLIGAGHYTTNATLTNVVTISKPITLVSSNGNPASVSIDGSNTNRGIAIYPVLVTYPYNIGGITVSNCWSSTSGGGIYISPIANFSGNLSNCVVSGNASAGAYGGGLCYPFLASPGVKYTIKGCTFSSNSAPSGSGGGIYFNSYGSGGASLLIISNCLISGNSAAGPGGGIHCGRGMTNIIQNCIVSGNRALSTAFGNGGGGISFEQGTSLAQVRNCLIYNNYSGERGGGIVLANSASSAGLYNCTIVSNSAVLGAGIHVRAQAATFFNIWNTIMRSNLVNGAVSDIVNYGTTTSSSCTNSCLLTNNIAIANCVFGGIIVTNSPNFVNFAKQDFHLQAPSPCINTGTNQDWMNGATDLDGQRRKDPVSGIVDMGCYEYVTRGTMFIIR